MISLDDTVLFDAVEVQVLRKQAAGTYVNGEWVPPTTAPETILATIQPVTGKDLKDLEEGLRRTARFSLWTLSPLATDEIVIYGGSNYRVMTSIPRPDGGYTKAVIGLLKAS